MGLKTFYDKHELVLAVLLAIICFILIIVLTFVYHITLLFDDGFNSTSLLR